MPRVISELRISFGCGLKLQNKTNQKSNNFYAWAPKPSYAFFGEYILINNLY